MTKPTGYRVISYGKMITDRPRMDAYVTALRQAVRPGSMVLDIGAGTGIFSLLACQFGAGEVHSVEPDDSIDIARQMASVNGFSDKIIFHKSLSTAVTLPRVADVIISDLRGVLPLFQHHIPAIVDARQRLMAPDGVLIPRRDTLWAAPYEDPILYRQYAEPWLENEHDLDLSAGNRYVVNTWRKINAEHEQLLATSQHWATLDYTTIEQPDLSGDLAWSASRSGTLHGIVIWFDAEVANSIEFSNAPDQLQLGYGQAFFPLEKPVILEKGDAVDVRLRANLVDDDYIWRWDTRVTAAGQTKKIKASFRQSTFYGTPIAIDKLKQREAGFVPQRGSAVDIDEYILSLIDNRTTLGEMAEGLIARFPGHIPGRQDALNRVSDMVQRYIDEPSYHSEKK